MRSAKINLEENFTEEELDALRLAFSRVDIEQSGAIAYEQLASAFKQVGMAPSAMEIGEAAARLGKPDDGSVDFLFADFAQMADMLSPVEQ